jgi:hypothetical protein
MEAALAERLLESIENDSLVVICGAGLSMSKPSNLPKASELAEKCKERYWQKYHQKIPAAHATDLGAIAEFFLNLGTFQSVFIQNVVPWEDFNSTSNAGHYALADFATAGVVDFVVSANYDTLIEDAAELLGERAFESSLNGDEANISRPHRTLLKIHGCWKRQKRETIWCVSQLESSPIKENVHASKAWLAGHLRERDLILIGFWSDWAYLNEILTDCVSDISPRMILLVAPDEPAVLMAKAPELWKWANSDLSKFFHVKMSGHHFLDALRRHFSLRFLEKVLADASGIYQLLTGQPGPETYSWMNGLSVDDLYSLRRDICGATSIGIPRAKRPDDHMHYAGAAHLWLNAQGAAMDGPGYILSGKRVRVVQGTGPLSFALRRYDAEPPAPTPYDITICAGAMDDGGVPSNFVRAAGEPGIVRPGRSGAWVTLDQAMNTHGAARAQP